MVPRPHIIIHTYKEWSICQGPLVSRRSFDPSEFLPRCLSSRLAESSRLTSRPRCLLFIRPRSVMGSSKHGLGMRYWAQMSAFEHKSIIRPSHTLTCDRTFPPFFHTQVQPVGGGQAIGSGTMWVAAEAESHPQAISMRADAAGVDVDAMMQYYLPPVRGRESCGSEARSRPDHALGYGLRNGSRYAWIQICRDCGFTLSPGLQRLEPYAACPPYRTGCSARPPLVPPGKGHRHRHDGGVPPEPLRGRFDGGALIGDDRNRGVHSGGSCGCGWEFVIELFCTSWELTSAYIARSGQLPPPLPSVIPHMCRKASVCRQGAPWPHWMRPPSRASLVLTGPGQLTPR